MRSFRLYQCVSWCAAIVAVVSLVVVPVLAQGNNTPGGGAITVSVNLNGFLSGSGRSPEVIGVTHLRTGAYHVRFNRDVEACVRVATLGPTTGSALNYNIFSGQPGEISMLNGFDNNGEDPGITVYTRDSAGVLADRDFHLAVFCQS